MDVFEIMFKLILDYVWSESIDIATKFSYNFKSVVKFICRSMRV